MKSKRRITASIKRTLFLLTVSIGSILTSCNSKPELSGTYDSDERTITGHPCETITFLDPGKARFNNNSLAAKIFDSPFIGGEKEFMVEYWNDQESIEFRRIFLDGTQTRKFKIENGNSVFREEGNSFRKR